MDSMADGLNDGSGHPTLNLTAEEKQVYGQLFRAADPDGFGAVSGDVAVTFFEKTKLSPDVLGEIWQIADTENRGLLTPPGFSVVLRLIGHAQAGRVPTAELASQAGPLPRFDGLPAGTPKIASQNTGQPLSPTQTGSPPIRVPSLSPEKASEYSSLFEKSGCENGLLSGVIAKQIFERAKLPNEVLGRIWNLADTQGRGALDSIEFTIAMHLLASCKSGTMRGVPQTLPPGLYDAAAKRAPARTSTGSYPAPSVPHATGISPQFTGMSAGRPQSPIAKQQVGTPLSAQSTGDGWIISPVDKARFDQIFAGLDKSNRGFITGDQAVEFFGNARLPEEVLAQIWDLADINSEGQLNRDEFAVAMYLIRQQRGTKEGRGNLPAALPPALIPPMMRKQQAAPSQPTAPAFENAPVTKPRSAADDLFGLDALTAPPSQAPQSTGGSTTGGPFQNPKSPPLPPTASSPSPPTSFKAFVPSSSFGQSIAPKQTGLPTEFQARVPPSSTSDDLLGDADPEVSQKLTPETSELANLSNQVGNLSKQMHEVQGTRGSAEQELSQQGQQRQEFESRLLQLRTIYEKEVKEVKALQEQLSAQRNDLKRLQQDTAMLEGSLEDLQNQRQQLSTALEAELREKAISNQKIRAANTEISELKPQVERIKSEARQQKGLVAISKKQLATLDTERDRIQEELDGAKADLDAAKKQVDDQAQSTTQSSSVTSPTNMASPAASTMSATNPFFRRGTGASEVTLSPPIASREQTIDRNNAFESMFGPSSTDPNTAAPPAASFRKESSSQSLEVAGTEVSPLGSPLSPSPSSTEPVLGGEPPAPPQSRQITSAALPFRVPLERADSVSSSVKVAPPASRLSPADTPRAVTPSISMSGGRSQNGESPDPVVGEAPSEIAGTSSSSPHSQLPTPPIRPPAFSSASDGSSVRSTAQDIPGAFPQFETPRSELPPSATAAGVVAGSLVSGEKGAERSAHGSDNNKEPEKKSDKLDANFDQYFGGLAHSRSPSQKAADFDSAFASLKQPATNGTQNPSNNEFPPIRELEDNESDDSSESPSGFDDNFTAASPPRPPKEKEIGQGQPEVASAVPASLQAKAPFNVVSSTTSSPPEAEAQKPPPSYGEGVLHESSDQFPPEFKGLLPHRGDPTSSRNAPLHPVAADTDAPKSQSGAQPYAPESAKSPPSTEQGIVPSAASRSHEKFTEDDFEAAFANMAPAPVADDDDEDDLDPAFANNNATEFDPMFDSQVQPKPIVTTQPPSMAASHFSTTVEPASNNEMKATNDFYNFSSKASNSQPSAPAGQAAPGATAFKDSDWDDMFAALDKPPSSHVSNTKPADAQFSPPPGPPPRPSNVTGAPTTADETSIRPLSPPQGQKDQDHTERPTPGRAISTGTDHDDPILKRVMAMGFSREDSLKALEEYDYNIDKAADYLTFKS